MPASNAPNAFLNSFMQGFSFIDDINSRKRQEQKLDERLAEEREYRKFARGMSERRFEEEAKYREFSRGIATAQEGRAAELHRAQIEEKNYQIEQREAERRGRAEALKPNPNSDILMEEALKGSTSAAAKLEQMGQRDRLEAAFGEINAMAAGGDQVTGGLSDQVTQSRGVMGPPPPPAPAEEYGPSPPYRGPYAPGQTPETPAPELTLGGEPVSTTFAPDRGLSSLVKLSEEDFNALDPAYKDRNLLKRAGGTIAGQAAQTLAAAKDVVQAPFTGAEALVADIRGIDRVTKPQDVGGKFFGEVYVPDAEYYSDEELEEITDPDARQLAIESNVQLRDNIIKRGRAPENNILKGPLSEQGAILRGGDAVRIEAERAQTAALSRWNGFNEGTGGMVDRAAEDPAGSAQLWLNDRATVESVDLALAQNVDRRMVPVFDQYEQALKEEVSTMQAGSVEQTHGIRRLSELQRSRNVIAESAPSVPVTAGINYQGMNVGNQRLTANVMAAYNDPSRPTRSTPHEQPRINAALTMVGRIKPSAKRLTHKQIEALVIAGEAGALNSKTMETILLTGTLPPPVAPSFTTREFDGNLYGFYENSPDPILLIKGKPEPLPAPTGSRTSGSGVGAAGEELNTENMEWMVRGAQTLYPEVDPRLVEGFVQDNVAEFRRRFSFNSEESMMQVGKIAAQFIILPPKEAQRLDDRWLGLGTAKNAPDSQTLWENPALMAQVAADNGIILRDMPEGAYDGIPANTDIGLVRQELASGAWGDVAADLASGMSDTDVWVFMQQLELQRQINLERQR
jgi:hypothetical protein